MTLCLCVSVPRWVCVCLYRMCASRTLSTTATTGTATHHILTAIIATTAPITTTSCGPQCA